MLPLGSDNRKSDDRANSAHVQMNWLTTAELGKSDKYWSSVWDKDSRLGAKENLAFATDVENNAIILEYFY